MTRKYDIEYRLLGITGPLTAEQQRDVDTYCDWVSKRVAVPGDIIPEGWRPARGCHANAYSDPPQECDAPFCGCNPAWTQAIEMLQECGMLVDKDKS